jgi:hypothetical protein
MLTDMYSQENVHLYVAEKLAHMNIPATADFVFVSVINDECEMCSGEFNSDDYLDAVEFFGGSAFLGSNPCYSGSSFIEAWVNNEMIYHFFLPNYENWFTGQLSNSMVE